MTSPQLLLKLRRRVIEIDYKHGHRHAPTSLSALPIIIEIFARMNLAYDTFILSKGHSCSALYAVLEEFGLKPDVTRIHPERDPANGIEITAGSLGHGLPIAVGIAYAREIHDLPGAVHVLLGDGECLEGTIWESLHLARRLRLEDRLAVHVDANGQQGAGAILDSTGMMLEKLFPIRRHFGSPGAGVKFFEDRPGETVHKITDAEFAEIMEGLK